MRAQSLTCLSTKDDIIKDEKGLAIQHEKVDDRIIIHVSHIAMNYRVLICLAVTDVFF